MKKEQITSYICQQLVFSLFSALPNCGVFDFYRLNLLNKQLYLCATELNEKSNHEYFHS